MYRSGGRHCIKKHFNFKSYLKVWIIQTLDGPGQGFENNDKDAGVALPLPLPKKRQL